jgi:hypothetical protein
MDVNEKQMITGTKESFNLCREIQQTQVNSQIYSPTLSRLLNVTGSRAGVV